MSVLPPEITAELGQLIQGLQSPDNNIRSQAEEALANNWTNTRPEVLLMGLAEHIAGSPDTAVRSFAAVIFRRIASKTRKNEQGQIVEMFLSLAKEPAVVIRQKLLETLGSETDKQVRNKISDSVAEVGRQYSEAGESLPPHHYYDDYDATNIIPVRAANPQIGEAWPELLTVLFQLSIADEPGKRESAFRVFNTTPGIIEKQHHDAVGQAFTKGFKDQAVGVREVDSGYMDGGANLSRRSVWQPWRPSRLSSGA